MLKKRANTTTIAVLCSFVCAGFGIYYGLNANHGGSPSSKDTAERVYSKEIRGAAVAQIGHFAENAPPEKPGVRHQHQRYVPGGVKPSSQVRVWTGPHPSSGIRVVSSPAPGTSIMPAESPGSAVSVARSPAHGSVSFARASNIMFVQPTGSSDASGTETFTSPSTAVGIKSFEKP